MATETKLPEVGTTITAKDLKGALRTFVVECVEPSGPNTLRENGSVALLGLKLDSPRATATYAADLYTSGKAVVLFSI